MMNRTMCHCATAALAAALCFGHATEVRANANLNAPDSVLVAEFFGVSWTGPDTAGDRITIAEPGAPAGSMLSTEPTSGGSTVSLQAPFTPGTYEIRYLEGGTNAVLTSRPLEVVERISANSGSGGAGTSSSGGSSGIREPADDRFTYDHILLARGLNKEFNERAGEGMMSRREMCQRWRATEPALRTAAGMAEAGMRQEMANADPSLAALLQRVEGALNMSGRDMMDDFQQQLEAAEADLCREEPAPYFQHFTITYAHCRMTMDTPTHSLDIVMPPGSASATMTAVDYVKQEGVFVDLTRDLAAALPATGAGWTGGITMNRVGGGRQILGRDAVHYAFKYTGGLGGGQLPMASMISTSNEGTAWVVDSIEGDSIPRRFYWDLSTQVNPAAGPGNFFAGLIRNLVGLMQRGLPLDIQQTVKSKIMGATTLSAKSHSIVNDIKLVPMPEGWCERSLVPSEFAITDVGQELDNAMSGGRAGGSQAGAPSNAEMDEAMREMNKALEQMTPEQRAMMEKMGLGSMMGGQAAQQPPAAASARSGARSRSDALASDNMTQMVQRYLDVLGYEVGNTNGEMDMQTTIAISQFQAEKDMKVTGEVSPQLAGMLAAEVDK